MFLLSRIIFISSNAAFLSSIKFEMLLPERPSLTALSIHQFISYYSVSLMIFNVLCTILPVFYTLFIVCPPLPKCKIHENKIVACLFHHYITNFENTDVLVYGRNSIKGCHMDGWMSLCSQAFCQFLPSSILKRIFWEQLHQPKLNYV